MSQHSAIALGPILVAACCAAAPACHRPLPGLPSTRAEYPATRAATASANANANADVPAAANPSAGAELPATLDAAAIRTLFAANHPELATARARAAEADAALVTAGAWPNPELGGRLLLGTSDGAISGEGAFLFPLPLGGRIGRAEAVAALDQALAQIDVAAMVLQVRVEADRQLARLAHARARLELLEALSERSAQYAALARERRAASMSDPLDVALVQADMARDRRARARERAAVRNAEAALRSQAGLPPGTGTILAPALQPGTLDQSRESLVQAAEQHRPALQRTRLAVARADAEAQLAAAERVPDLHLGPAVAGGESGGVSVGVQAGMPVPLLQSGRGPYEQALARRGAALAEHRAEARRAVVEVMALLNRLVALDEEIDALTGEPIAAAEQAFGLARARYEAGNLDVLRLLSAHRAFADLKLEYLDLLLARQEVQLDLELATGRALTTAKETP